MEAAFVPEPTAEAGRFAEAEPHRNGRGARARQGIRGYCGWSWSVGTGGQFLCLISGFQRTVVARWRTASSSPAVSGWICDSRTVTTSTVSPTAYASAISLRLEQRVSRAFAGIFLRRRAKLRFEHGRQNSFKLGTGQRRPPEFARPGLRASARGTCERYLAGGVSQPRCPLR
jgi:hypothetical protein